MNWLSLFTSFEGRISRKTFWIGIAVLVVLEALAAVANQQIDDDRLAAVIDLVLIYPEFAVAAKRAHDRNISTWVIGIFFAFSAVFDVLVLAGLISENPSFEGSNAWMLAIVLPIGLFALILFVDLGFRRGTRGPNRFGPDPVENAA